MLLPNDQRKVDYCRDNNGICPYRHRVCDGLCNNCGLDAVEVENYHITFSRRRPEIEGDYEAAILARTADYDE